MRHLQARVSWLITAPLLAAIAVIGVLLWYQTEQLEQAQTRMQQEVFLAARREELKSYIQLALTSIDHLYGAGRDDEQAKHEARGILRSISFGTDGYFFVYDLAGRNIVHPRQPELQGRNLMELRDRNGVAVIRELIARAREGGGFQRYDWPKPSLGEVAPKLGYAVQLERWGWMLGTGLYLDDIEAAAHQHRAISMSSMRGTLVGLSVVAIVAVLTVFAGGVFFNIHEQRRANRKIRDLAERVVKSQEEERARVSRELHDHICQLLVSIKYRFEYATHRALQAPADGLVLVREATLELSQAIGQVRQLSHGLRPALLDDLGLPAALQHLGDDLAQRTGLAVHVRLEPDLPALTAEQQVELFRIAQESLRNVEQHAHASQVSIELSCTRSELLLRIGDDGTGFDVDAVERSRGGGIGLSNLRHRAESIGARFGVRSGAGGTHAELRLPTEAQA